MFQKIGQKILRNVGFGLVIQIGTDMFDDIINIRDRFIRGESVTSIAYLYGVLYNTINSIKLGRSWKNIK